MIIRGNLASVKNDACVRPHWRGEKEREIEKNSGITETSPLAWGKNLREPLNLATGETSPLAWGKAARLATECGLHRAIPTGVGKS